MPTITFMDKSPTPTRFLKAVDEIGLFRDDDRMSSAKSTSSNNPFDEHFRNALNKKENIKEQQQSNDEMLNTPQIFHDLQSAPPSAKVIVPPCEDIAEPCHDKRV